MAIVISGTGTIDGISAGGLPDDCVTADDLADTYFVPSTQLSHRNLLINGDMRVSQRGTDINDVSNDGYTADRWKIFKNNADQMSLDYDNVSDAPNGFSNSLKVTVATAETTVDANEWTMVCQSIEGLNLQHLKCGTSFAQDLTVSFWVKSSLTGTYIVNLFCPDFSASPNRKYYSTTYTIDTANTWEYKTVTLFGNTNSGDTISNDNTEGMRLGFMLGAGSNFTSGTTETWGNIDDWAVGINNNFFTTTNATWQITGVQLEVGSVATPFEHRSYGEELARCERYYQIAVQGSQKVFAMGTVWSNNAHYGVLYFRPMRTTPTFTDTTGSGYYRFRTNGSSYNHSDMGFADITAYSCMIYGDGSGGTNGQSGWWDTNNASAKISLDAEL